MRRRPAGASRRRGVFRRWPPPSCRGGRIPVSMDDTGARAGHNGWREADGAGRSNGRPRRRSGDRGGGARVRPAADRDRGPHRSRGGRPRRADTPLARDGGRPVRPGGPIEPDDLLSGYRRRGRFSGRALRGRRSPASTEDKLGIGPALCRVRGGAPVERPARREVLRRDPASGRGAGDGYRGGVATAGRAAPPPGHRTVGRRVADGVRRPRRTSPHRPGTARRGGAPHYDDRLAG